MKITLFFIIEMAIFQDDRHSQSLDKIITLRL